MYKSKIGLIALVSVAVSFTLLISSTALSQETQETYEGVELQYVTTSPMVTEGLDKEFEKLTGAKVNVTSVSWPDLHAKLVVPFATKQSVPDIFMFPEEWIGEFGEAGWFLPIENSLSKEEKAQLVPGVRNMYTYKGHLAAFAEMAMPVIMFYNKKMLDEGGFEPAKTWDEFANQSRTLKAAGMAEYGITWPLATGYTFSIEGPFTSMLLSQGGSVFDDEGNPIFNSELGVRTLQFIIDTLFELEIADPISMQADKRECLIPFMQGENPYNFNYQFMYAITTNPADSSIAEYSKYALNPGAPGVDITGFAAGGALGINPNSKHKEAAIAYAKFITSKENVLTNFEKRGWMPWWSSFYDDPKALAIEPQLPILKAQLERSRLRPGANYSWYPEFGKIMRLEVSRAWLDKEVTAKEALDDAVKKVSELIAKQTK